MESLANTVSPFIDVDGMAGAVNPNVDSKDGVENEAEDGDSSEHGVFRPRMLIAPNPPSKQERMEHEVTHLPYRTWCAHCVRGRGRDDPHHDGPAAADKEVPIISMDCWKLSGALVMKVRH